MPDTFASQPARAALRRAFGGSVFASIICPKTRFLFRSIDRSKTRFLYASIIRLKTRFWFR
jgi:hypothetical protein